MIYNLIMETVIQVDKKIVFWYIGVIFLICCIIIVGGLTRLTGSGLSMVDWNLFVGMIPPVTTSQWQALFLDYQAYPEYIYINSQMTLSEFKFIFLWEYWHRMLGRLIGLALIIPYIIFSLQKKIPIWLHKRSLIMIVLVILQGLMGWYMVKSGLVDVPSVSHFRLAAHLLLACLLLQYIVWTVLDIKQRVVQKKSLWFKGSIVVLVGLVIQMLYGAFTSGLKAGLGYNTYPKMAGEWIPSVVTMLSPFSDNFLYNKAMIQFVHRHFALFVGLFFLIFAILILRSTTTSLYQKKVTLVVFFLFIIQILLGIFTLIYVIPISLAAGHQFVGVLLLTSVVVWVHALRYSS